MRGIFVTGTDTDVGKTVVSAALTLGLDARYWKPIQAGTREPTDTDLVRRWTGLPQDRFPKEAYLLGEPMSPHAAADIDGVRIEIDRVCEAARLLTAPGSGPLVVEGAGGLLVPLAPGVLGIDLIGRLGLPVALVARTSLGTLNHTLLSLEALRSRGIRVLGVVLNGEEHRSNHEAIERYGSVEVLGRVTRLARFDRGSLLAAFHALRLPEGTPDPDAPSAQQPPRARPSPPRPSTAPNPHVWHPFTPVEGGPAPLKVVRGRGATLELEDGRPLLDGISSWWVNLHGHGHPRIVEAIRAQAARLEHVLFAGFTHEPAERLADELTDLLPHPLRHVFYSDDGSTSVEVALKMAWQYWRNRGEPRTRFLAFEGAYHGDTFGAMAAGARSLFTETFGDLLFDVDRVPFPETWTGDDEVEGKERAALARLDEALDATNRAGGGRVAAVIMEPLVQGAGGMRMCRPEFVRAVAARTRAQGSLLILDEVMTGFGRTGEWFASRRAGVVPDLICLAKGLTGGFVPLAVTVASDEVFEAFRSAAPGKTFWHGHSYTANPIGCAAALASIGLLREDERAFREVEAHHRGFLEGLPSYARRRRVTGTIVAFDLPRAGARSSPGEDYLDPIGPAVRAAALERGLLLRPLGNTVYLMPPYCLTDAERERMYEAVTQVVRSLP